MSDMQWATVDLTELGFVVVFGTLTWVNVWLGVFCVCRRGFDGLILSFVYFALAALGALLSLDAYGMFIGW